MAMTVTATMSGTPANEHIYLWIRVLTNATETGGASVASLNAAGGATVTASLTPNFSGSLPCFALTADNWGGSYTAATSNTIDSNTNDPDDWGAGFGRYTGTVTGGTPLTFGASGVGGGCDYSTWACYEVPSSGGTVTVDGSSPALASATGASVKTVTSASFTPPAGSVVVASVCGGGNGTSGTFTIAVTDTGGGLTWTKRAGNTTAADQNTAIFTATVGGGGGAAPSSLPIRWLRVGGATRLRRQYMPKRRALLNVPQPVAPAAGFVTLAGAGSLTPTVSQAATATLNGAGSLLASVGPPCITGLGGTGAGYFIDSSGQPRMVLGDAAWALPGNAGRWNSGAWQTDFDTYLANRASQGFTVIYTKPIGTTQSGNIDDNGKTFDALYPFQGGSPSTGVAGANPSSGLTSAFWARIDYFLASALAKGITVFLNAIGYASDFDSGPGPLAGKSTTEFTAYGTALGTRYKNQPNLVWHLADDYFGDNDSLITAFMTGVTGAGDTHAVSIENMAESTSRKTLDAVQVTTTWGAANAEYNFCYSYNPTYYGVEKAYLESSPIPVIQGDGYFYQGGSTYAGGSGAFAYDRAIRQDAWHAISSGARGIIHGSESIWQYASTALAASSTDWYYANNAGHIRSIMESLPGWHTLVPDTSSALVTAGRGTHASARSSGGGGGQYEVAFTDSYVTASRSPDSGSGASLAVIYLSHGTTITIDQTKMVSGYTATWVDPITGATSSATAGSSYNSTAKGNNSQGDPDWVLVLQAPASVPGAATLPGAGSFGGTVREAVTATLNGLGSLGTPAAASTATLNGAGSLTGTVSAIPYVIANTSGTSGSTTYNLAISHASTAGDGVTVLIGVGGTAPPAITSVTDSQGQKYIQRQQSATSPYEAVFTCPGSIALSTSDTFNVTFAAATTGGISVIAVGTPGMRVVDANTFATGSSATPSVTGTVGTGGEIALGLFTWANGAGAGSLTGGQTQLAQSHPTGGAWATVGYVQSPAPGSLSLSASITSGAWRATILTLKPSPAWYMTNSTFIHQMYLLDPASTSEFFNMPSAFAISNSASSTGIQDGFTCTPVLKYVSYAQLQADITASAISSSFHWLMYDNEYADDGAGGNSWGTPMAEANDPWTYMASFVTLAHANGYSVILAPGRDLGNNATSVNPKTSETLDAWYIRTNIAGVGAGTGAEVMHVQTQADTVPLATFEGFYNSTLAQIAAASATCQASCGVSTNYGAASDMQAAAQYAAPTTWGYWLNATTPTISQASNFLELMGGFSATGSTTLTGTGSITGTFPSAGAATLPGAGSITGTVAEQPTDTLAGSGSLNSAETEQATATLPGAGSFGGTPTVQVPGAAPLAAAGSFGAAATEVTKDTLAAAGSIGALDVGQAPATLPGAGSFGGTVVEQAAGIFAGAGSITGSSGQASGGAATLAAAGSFSGTPSVSAPGAATLAGAGSLSGTPSVKVPGAETLAGAGSFGGPTTGQSAGTLTGTGSFPAAATEQAPALLGGTGSITGSSAGTATGTATLAGAGSLNAPAVGQVTALLPGAGSLSTSATGQAPETLSAAGSIAGSGTDRSTDTLAAAGSLAASPAGAGGTTLAGAGTFGTPLSILAAPVVLAAAGSLAGTGSVSSSTSATLNGTGALNATVSVVPAGLLAATGSITGTAILRATDTLTGSGSIATQAPAGTGSATLPGTASFTTGATGQAPATLAGAGTFSGFTAISAPQALSGVGQFPAIPTTGTTAALNAAGSFTGISLELASDTLAAAGTLTSAVRVTSLTILTGAGSLSGTARTTAPALLAAAGSISGTGQAKYGSLLAAAGQLNAQFGQQLATTISAAGSLSGTLLYVAFGRAGAGSSTTPRSGAGAGAASSPHAGAGTTRLPHSGAGVA